MDLKAKFALAVVAIAIGSVASVALTDQEEVVASFTVEEADLELGTVVAGQDAVATYVFHNETDRDVKIIRAKPS